MQKEMTWKQFNEVYGVGITEMVSHDVEIVPSKFGFEPRMKGRLFNDERNTAYTYNVYNLETEKNVLTSEWSVETVEEIVDIIRDEFNIVDN